MISDTDWDPTIYDNNFSDSTTWYDSAANERTHLTNPNFDQNGNYRHKTVAKHSMYEQLHYFDTSSFEPPDEDDNILLYIHNAIITIPDGDDCVIVPPPDNNKNTDEECMIVPPPRTYPHKDKPMNKPNKVSGNKPDYESLRPLFGWLPTDTIKQTFQLTPQYARTPMSAILNKHYKSPFPALNVTRRDEHVATDTIYSDTPAVDNRCKQAQIFVGTKTTFTDVYGMKTDSQFVNTLEDYICDR